MNTFTFALGAKCLELYCKHIIIIVITKLELKIKRVSLNQCQKEYSVQGAGVLSRLI